MPKSAKAARNASRLHRTVGRVSPVWNPSGQIFANRVLSPPPGIAPAPAEHQGEQFQTLQGDWRRSRARGATGSTLATRHLTPLRLSSSISPSPLIQGLLRDPTECLPHRIRTFRRACLIALSRSFCTSLASFPRWLAEILCLVPRESLYSSLVVILISSLLSRGGEPEHRDYNGHDGSQVDRIVEILFTHRDPSRRVRRSNSLYAHGHICQAPMRKNWESYSITFPVYANKGKSDNSSPHQRMAHLRSDRDAVASSDRNRKVLAQLADKDTDPRAGATPASCH